MLLLGLSCDIDAAATLVQDGAVIAASAEERFSRVKHDRSFPGQASRFCLQWAAARLEDLDWVALGWNPTIHLQPLLWRRSGRVRHLSEYLSSVPNLLLQQYRERPRGIVTEQLHHFDDGRPPLRLAFVEHHLSHAAWAFVSPFERAAVLTIDGFGEQCTTMLALCEGTSLRVLGRVGRPHSLGSLYAALTQYLGFVPNRDEGTVMSLAALGEPRFAGELRRMIRLGDGQSASLLELDLSQFAFYLESPHRVSEKFIARFGPPRRPDEPLEQRHRDWAASLQDVFEEAYLHLLRLLERRAGCRDLVVAGGAALNCVANGRILKETGFARLFIPPAAGDDGAAAGAALYLHHVHLGQARQGAAFSSAYLGPAWEAQKLQDGLDLAQRAVCRLEPGDLPRVVATLLAEGFVVGWFQGRAEFGPRALGNRSILADPRSAEIRDRINAAVKFRLPFRPLAPSVLAHRAAELYEGGGPSPYMLRAFRVSPAWAGRLAGAVHVDGTSRVQTVTPEDNPLYHALIEQFEALTGVPAVINTSLNVRGQPMAHTMEDALACFDTTAMDFLVLGEMVLAKPRAACQQALERALAGARSREGGVGC